MLAPTRKEPLYRASLGISSAWRVFGSRGGSQRAMRDYDFVARLIGWLEMPGEGEPYPHDANPHPADPRDASSSQLRLPVHPLPRGR